MKVDLHLHSTASDGWFSPTDIVGLAAAHGLSHIALCDHDTIDGVPSAQNAASTLGVTVIEALELSTLHNGKDIHILGYWIDITSTSLKETLAKHAEASTQRVLAMANKLTRAGYAISESDLSRVATGGMYRRPHLARILLQKGYVASIGEAFQRFVGDDSLYYVPCEHLNAFEAIDLITAAGGLPFIAHPAVSNATDEIGPLVEAGLRGVEAFHSHQTDTESARLLEIAKQHALLVSGGSDWHGEPDEPGDFGISMLPEPYVDAFLAAAPR